MPVDTTTPPKLTRAESARHNGAKSRGPKTDLGKSISSQNGIKLGMYSSRVVLKNESQEIYAQLKDLYIQRWQPVDAFEYELVETMVNCRWRLRRLEAIETASMDLAALENTCDDPGAQQALAYQARASSSASPEQISRHEERLNRQFHRAVRTLTSNRAKKPKTGILSGIVAAIVALFSCLLSFNFQTPDRREEETQLSPSTLLKVLDRHPHLRAALLQAMQEPN